MKNIAVYSPMRFRGETWLPTLWSQSKTYYERHGTHANDWYWVPCYADIYADDLRKVKIILGHAEPDVLAVSLYVWNYQTAHQVARWVKETWPHCFVITGGPHQNFRYDLDWFRDHPYIDASLPGECYGEICFQELLDNIQDDGSLDPDLVTDLCYPRGTSRRPAYSKKRSDIRAKKQFDYDFTVFADQQQHIERFIHHCRCEIPDTKLLAVMETTRGCPYGCTYCDWGGGTNTAVIRKSVPTVQRDMDFLCSLGLEYLYIADANLGIFGDRDVEIMENLVETRRRHSSQVRLGYGGWAKTENRLPYIRRLLELDIENSLSNSNEIKISMQSLDPVVLHNIDRKNIDLDLQLEYMLPLSRENRLPLYVEMIMGLPGMDLDKFYHELDVLGQRDLSVMWFEWLLLPETPAFDPAYRERFGIKTVMKTQGWACAESGSERHIVIETSSYSRLDYLEMLLAAGLYNAMVQGGAWQQTMVWIQRRHGICMGQIIRRIMQATSVRDDVSGSWLAMLDDPSQACVIDVNGQPVYYLWYWAARLFMDTYGSVSQIQQALIDAYDCPRGLLAQDRHAMARQHGPQSSRWLWWIYNQPTSSWDHILRQFQTYTDSGKVMRATRRFLL